MKKNGSFFYFNTDSRISLCARAHYLRYAEGSHQGHQIAFLDSKIFILFRKNTDFVEFKVNLIHRKLAPLLHNTVLILCDEGAELAAASPCFCL